MEMECVFILVSVREKNTLFVYFNNIDRKHLLLRIYRFCVRVANVVVFIAIAAAVDGCSCFWFVRSGSIESHLIEL